MYEEIVRYISDITNPAFYAFPDAAVSPVDEQAIYAAITSSKFKKTTITSEAENDIRIKLHNAIVAKRPLSFALPFGAYKSWRLNVGFLPEWAEVFHLSYLLKYAANMLAVYPYGISFTFSFANNLMYFVSDFPRDPARQYVQNFRELLKLFNKLDSRVTFNLVEINGLYESDEDYYIDFLKQFLDNLVFWDEKYDEATRNRHLNSSRRNLHPYGLRAIAEQPQEIQDKYYYYSALMTDAVDCLRERRKFNKMQERIQLVGVKGPSKCINIGGCETSTVHFWVSKGVLCINKGKLRPYMYTFKNITELLDSGQVEIVPIESVFGSINNNYKNIYFIGGKNEKN